MKLHYAVLLKRDFLSILFSTSTRILTRLKATKLLVMEGMASTNGDFYGTTDDELSGKIQADSPKMDDLAVEISANTADLEAASSIRSNVVAECLAAVNIRGDGVDVLTSAIRIILKISAKQQQGLGRD